MSQTHEAPRGGSTTSGPPRTPRWVKVMGIIFIVLVLLAGIILITGIGGEHGPSRHMPSGEAGETPVFNVTEERIPRGEAGDTAFGGQRAPLEQVAQLP